MANPKKVQLAYKKYVKNYQDGSLFEDSITTYEEMKNQIEEIAENNETDKDHILLIRIGSIFAHYHLMWKKDVLMNGSSSIDSLKQLQISMFYQCISQDLYKIRYPNMMVIYTFKEIVAALIHFTMYGWEKEENILFDFMVDHLGENAMSANEWNKHTWFLLELYLQYRNKTIYGANRHVSRIVKEKLQASEMKHKLIPEDLEIYAEVLEKWTTSDEEELVGLINKMVMYHSELVSELGESLEFGDYRYGFYPYEILFLIHVRKKKGLPVPEHFEALLMNTPEAKMVIKDPEPYPEKDPLLMQIVSFYRRNYPEYVLNRYGEELFQ